MNSLNKTRRNVLRSICAAALATSLPVVAQESLIPAQKPKDVPNQVAWLIPEQNDVIRRLVKKETDLNAQGSFDNGMWTDRSISLVEVLWPAMEITARKGNMIVDHNLYQRMTHLENLVTFAVENAQNEAGKNLNAFLYNLPGYVKGKTINESTRHQFYFLTMMCTYAIREYA